MRTVQLVFLTFLLNTTIFAQSQDQIKEEVWQRELQYWKYVEQNDKVNYLTLWHNDFVGYPDSEIVRKGKIADWISEVHNRKGAHYEFSLSKKEVNVFGDVVITFYDESDIWKNDQNEVVAKETFKITHTWKKYGDKWLIIGGMSALKKE